MNVKSTDGNVTHSRHATVMCKALPVLSNIEGILVCLHCTDIINQLHIDSCYTNHLLTMLDAGIFCGFLQGDPVT